MVLVQDDLKLCKSEYTVNGISSLGGARTSTIITENVSSLWDNIKSSELSGTVVGEYEVRCIYVTNLSPNDEIMEDVAVWLRQNTVSPYTDVDIGIGLSAAGDSEQTVTDENTLPLDISWSFARGEENALSVGPLAKDQGKSLWIRRHAGPARADSSTASDNYVLEFRFKKSAGTGPGPGPGPGPSTNDPFGIRMVYPTNTFEDASLPFYIKMADPLNDCRLSTNEAITKNPDGSLAMGASARIRLYIDTNTGCAKDLIFTAEADTYDHDIWGERQYMYAIQDWRNVEITGHFKCVGMSTESERKLYLYSRTWRHNTNVGGGCGGSAYKAVIYGATGELKFHKESFHDGAQPCGDRNIYKVPDMAIKRTDDNKWYGFKFMMWNYLNASGLKNVHLEIWLDLNADNTWIKYAERDDTGGWYPGAPDPNCIGDEHCGGHQDQIIHWGGPITEIRWDGGYTNVHFRYLSCREIIPPTVIPPIGGPPGGGPPPPTPPANALWDSSIWSNGSSRTLNPSDFDPSDPKMHFWSEAGGTAVIAGTGIANISGITARLFIHVDNLNTTLTTSIISNSTLGDVNLNIRSKHNDTCCFGGYEVHFDWVDQDVGITKEPVHGIFGDKQNVVSLAGLGITLPTIGTTGLRATIETLSDGSVKISAYIRVANTWTFITSYTDTDANTDGLEILEASEQAEFTNCAAQGDRITQSAANMYKPWLNSGNMCWIRCNGLSGAAVTNVGITEASITDTAAAAPAVDVFGIKKIYNDVVGSTGWAATTWSNGHSRTFGSTSNCAKDPDDSRFSVAESGNPKITIDGNGIMKAGVITGNTGSPRVSIDGAWQNIETTVYFRFPSANSTGSCDLRPKNQHYCMPGENVNHFGGYLTGAGFGTEGTSIRKEKSHTIGYGPRINPVPLNLTADIWYGIKGICYNLANGHVKLEIYMDTTDGLNGGTWTKITEGIDDGTWEGSPDTGTYERASIRTNISAVDSYAEYKKWTVRKIAGPTS